MYIVKRTTNRNRVQKRFEVDLVVLVLITAHRAIKGPSEKGRGAQHSISGGGGGKEATPTKSIF